MAQNPIFSPIIRPLGPLVSALTGAKQALYRPPQTTIAGINETLWPSPLQPVTPMGPPRAEPLQWPFNWGRNLIFTPRDDAEYSALDLRMLAKYPLARVCIENTKDMITRMPHRVQLKPLAGETSKERAQRSKADPHLGMLNKFIARPNPRQNWSDFLRPILEDMLVIDGASIFLARDGQGKVKELWPIDGASITVLVEEHGLTPSPPNPAYQQLWEGYPRIDLTTDQLMYRPRNIAPRGTQASHLYGFSPCEQVAKEIMIGLARLQFVYDFYKEGSIPGGIHFVPPGVSPDKIKEAQEYLDATYGGNLAARRKLQLVQGWQAEGHAEQVLFPKEPALADAFDDVHIRKICFAFGTSPQRLQRMMNRACYSSDTETLTDRGWLSIDRITDEDLIAQYNPESKSIEYVKPLNKFVYPYSGEMISFKNKYVDILVTPEHNMWTRFVNDKLTKTGKKHKNIPERKHKDRWNRTWGLTNWNYQKIKAGDIKRDVYFTVSANFEGEERESFIIPAVMNTHVKLSENDVNEIKRDGGTISQDILAKRYGVHQTSIMNVLNGVRLNIRSKWTDAIEIKMDDWLEFLGYFLSEGMISHEHAEYEIGLSQRTNSPFTPKIDDCLERLSKQGLKYTRRVLQGQRLNEGAIVAWHISNKALHTYFKNTTGGYCYEKRIPREFLFLSKRQLRILFDALMAGDGSWGNGSKGGRTRLPDMWASTWGNYSTTSNQLVDDFQELAFKLGYSNFTSVQRGKDVRHRDVYTVNINMQSEFSIDKEKITKTQYDGQVYCFEVPTGLMVTRHNGKIAIQGNSAQSAQESAEEEGTLPWMDWLKGLMDDIIQRYLGFQDYEFAFDPFHELDKLKQAQSDVLDVENGLYTPNEIRERRGDDPRPEPEADVLNVKTTMGFIPLGSVAQTGGTNNGAVIGKPSANQKPKAQDRGTASGARKVAKVKANGHSGVTWPGGCAVHKNSYPRSYCPQCAKIETAFAEEREATV
jgi:Phage portal protein